MSTSVDTKIVELKFNNDNFAQKVDSTLTKLEQLNKDIKNVGMKDALKNLSKGVKNVDLNPITKGIDEVNKGFSKMEVAGITAIANIANTAVNFGKKIARKFISPITDGIMKGGLARARNIEQATFSFEGQKIGKSEGNESLAYYKEVMDAVLGTSYSYDVAAKAASQFAASNIGVIETTKKLADGSEQVVKTLDPTTSTHQSTMTSALLGVAGVASMTGRSFEDVSRVFTKIAGNNRVYAQDLQSFSTMGLNAAAVLASAMDTTEEHIYEMVKSGDIHFQEFSDAMNKAFGQHAKDSTLMFQGALDDVNAALARIGADFYGPALNAGRDILNSFTPLVDAIHTKLQPALDGSGTAMDKASKSLSQYLDMLSYLIEMYPEMDRSKMGDWIIEHMNAWTNIADLYKRGDIVKTVEGLSKASKKWNGMEGEGISGYRMLGDYLNIATDVDMLNKYLDKTPEEIDKIVKKGKIGAEDLKTVINGMLEDGIIGFNTFYKSFHKLWSESDKLINIATINDDFIQYTRNMIGAEEPSERFNQHLSTFASIIQGCKSLLSSFAQILGGFGDIFLTLARHLKPLGQMFLIAVEDIAKFVVKLADFVATSESFSAIIDGLVSIVNKMFDLVNVSKIAELAITGLHKAFDFILKAVETVQHVFQVVVGTIAKVFAAIVDKINSVISSSEELSNLLQSLKNAGIVIMIINLIDMLAQPAVLLKALGDAIGGVGKSFSGMVSNIAKAFESIASIAGKVGEVIDEVKDALYRLQQLIVATTILELAFAIAAIAGAFYILSKVPWNNVEVAAGTIISFALIVGTVWGGIERVTKKISGVRKFWEKSVNDIKSIGFAFVEMAVAVAIIAGALYKLAKIDPKQLLIATGVVEALLVTMGLIAALLSGRDTTTKSTGLKSLWSGQSTKTSKTMTKGLLGLVAMAEAVKIVAKALVSVATITDPEAMYNALAVIEALMWTMFAMTKWLSSTETTKMTKGIGSLLAMAVAVRMLVKPIMQLSAIAATGNDAMWSAVGAISVLMLVMSMLMKMLSGSKGLVKAGVGIVLMAKSLQMLSEVVVAFSSLDAEAMWQSIIGMGVALGSIVLALALVDTDGLLAKAIAFIIIAKCLQTLSEVILAFGANNEQAWAGIGVAAIALLGLAGACYVFEKVPVAGILKLFLTLALGALLVAGFGAAVGVLGVGLGVLGVGLSILATSLGALTPVLGTFIGLVVSIAVGIAVLASVGLPAAGVIAVLALAFLLLGAGMLMIGTGLSDMAAAIKILHELKDDLTDTTDKITLFIKTLKGMTKDAEAIGESFKTIAKPLKSIRTSAETITEQIEKLSDSYTELISKSSECIASLADSLTTISKLNQDSFGSATEAVKNFISGLSDISKDAETVSTTSQSISESLGELKESFDLVKNVIDSFKSRSVKIFEDLGNSLNDIATPIQTLNDLRGELESLANDLMTFVTNLMTMKENASTVSEGATAIADALKQVGDAAAIAKDGFDGLTKKTANILEKMGKGLTSIAKGFTDIVAVKDQLDSAASSIESFYTKLSSLNDMSATIAGGTRAVSSAIKTLGQSAEKTASLSRDGMSRSGSKMVDGLVAGIGAKQTDVETKVTSIVDSAASKVRQKYNDWRDIGSYLIQGIINGISNQQYALEQQVQAVEAKSRRMLQAKLRINSPSKVYMSIGESIGEGLSMGIAKTSDEVTKAAVGLATVSEDAVKATMQSISKTITDDIDSAPTITPVLDLTNVRSGANFISSALNSSLGLYGSGMAASITHTIQNGGKSDMEKSIDDLTDQIGVMTDTMNSRSLNNYINIDGSTDPEAFADGLIRSFRLNARTV